MSLTGSASVANYQAALRSVTYVNASENPSTALRTASFTVNDGALASNIATRTITVSAVNDAPVEATIEGATLAYTENGAATAITSTLTVSDVDSANLASATVQITGNYANGQDILAFTNANGISGTFNASRGAVEGQCRGDAESAGPGRAVGTNPRGVARTAVAEDSILF
ncbi:MAG: hypothetical protein EXR27_13800 [Betaproteobacteria bacterium]|nr:hypothetical protein [Betaproteobacteria bacterium]